MIVPSCFWQQKTRDCNIGLKCYSKTCCAALHFSLARVDTIISNDFKLRLRHKLCSKTPRFTDEPSLMNSSTQNCIESSPFLVTFCGLDMARVTKTEHEIQKTLALPYVQPKRPYPIPISSLRSLSQAGQTRNGLRGFHLGEDSLLRLLLASPPTHPKNCGALSGPMGIWGRGPAWTRPALQHPRSLAADLARSAQKPRPAQKPCSGLLKSFLNHS